MIHFSLVLFVSFSGIKFVSQYLLYPEIKCFNDSLLIVTRYNVQAYDIMQLKGKIKENKQQKKVC